MNDTINRAIRRARRENKTMYVYSTYLTRVISTKPAPFGRHCWKVDPSGTVSEIG
jgi:hypothetical protein